MKTTAKDQTGHRRQRVYFAVNNKSGNANEDAVRSAADRLLTDAGVACDYFVRDRKGKSRRDATQRAIEKGFDTIVAVGGDGTVSKVADEIQQSDAVLGIIPTGSVNLIARSLNTPLDIDDAMKLISEVPAINRMDEMRVKGKTFFSHISMGFILELRSEKVRPQKNASAAGLTPGKC